MRRFFTVFLALLCCAGLCMPVLADSGLSSLSSDTGVQSDGSCDVVLSAQLVLEETVADLWFPVPFNAEDVILNGEGVSPTENGQIALVSLYDVTGGRPGQFSFTLRYSLPSVVQVTEEEMLLELPVLCGFSYPVENFRFTLTFPASLSHEPVFTSSYYQESILSHLELSQEDRSITGHAQKLKDHETLLLRMPVTAEMFPKPAAAARTLSQMDLFTAIAAALAALYYLITMLPRFPRRHSRSAAPDGITAGNLALWRTGKGIDLSLMVVTWAQLGYLRMQVDDSGRVLLHKRMDMGNERSQFEIHCFQLLFGRRQLVDGTGYHYANLCRSLRRKTPGIRDIYRRRTGNPRFFRILCILPALLNGISLAAGFSPNSVFLQVLLSLVASLFAIAIHSGGISIPSRNRRPLHIALICSAIWLLLGLLSGKFIAALLVTAFELLSGLAAAHGGKRTELGQQAADQIFALKRHMKKVPKKELQQILKRNPGYFHQLAPYALAMNMDRAFAGRFGHLRLSECTYLVATGSGHMTAWEWARLLRSAVRTLDHRADRLPIEKLTGR